AGSGFEVGFGQRTAGQVLSRPSPASSDRNPRGAARSAPARTSAAPSGQRLAVGALSDYALHAVRSTRGGTPGPRALMCARYRYDAVSARPGDLSAPPPPALGT